MGVLASVASVFYYLRVVVTMFMSEPASPAETPAPATPEGATYLALGIGTLCIVLFFFMPALYLFDATR
jgi:NADH:ubiquinone oxidoreductase subunit 2 (subunit N)